MSMQKNLITLCFATVFTLGLAACSSGGSSPVTMMEPDPPTEPTEPTELETVQADAVTAAMAAGDAATAAKTASDAALAAMADRAVIQTGDLSGGNSGMLANSAYMQAKAAADEATAAQTASDAAAAATDVATATRALVMAEAARDNAVTAQGMAETHRDAAIMASDVEVKIVEKTKTVGPVDDQTSITVDGVAKSSTIDTVTRRTGLIPDGNLALTTPGVRDQHGRLVAPVNVDGDALPLPVPPRTAGTPSIGFTYDSSDDTARLTLVTAYLGSQKQMQFVRVEATNNPFVLETNEVGPLLTTPQSPPSGDGVGVDGAYMVDDEGKITIDHDRMDTTDAVTVAPKLAGDHFVDSDNTEMTASLYYVETGKEDETAGNDVDGNGTVDPAEKDDGIDDTKRFLERNFKSGITTYTPVAVIEVTVDNATPFKHIHYGLWNALSGSGANTVADLGTGFVNALSDGMGMTNPDHEAEGGMPNFGDAKYNGNWVANIQEADGQGDGAITRHDGTSSMTADFMQDTVKVALDGLATLDGAISENTFSGDSQPKLSKELPGGLAANADDFTGSFSGAFFGPSAAEAGGVFDYASKDNKNGAFRGAFGGTK